MGNRALSHRNLDGKDYQQALKVMDQPITYYEYIHSELWRSRASAYKLRVGYRCEHCGSIARLQCHHLNYSRLGNETDEDLIALCESCHKKIHNLKGVNDGKKMY